MSDETGKNNSSGQHLDVLFVHVPRFNCYYPALNMHNSCNRMAMGLLALADLVDRNGYRARLIHVGIEHRLNKNFSFAVFLREHRPKLIGFSQHFHHNLVDTLQWASVAKQTLPDSMIVLGGFTSTFFAQDLIEKAPFVDAVCKGDAEQPLLALCKRFIEEKSRDLTGLPNFVWKKNNSVQDNEQSYTITQDILDRLDFTNFRIFDHAKEYIAMPKAPVHTNIPGKFDKLFNGLTGKDKGNIYYGLPVGRGCLYNCCYCGGSNKAQRKINHRAGIVARKQDDVIHSIRELIKFGFAGSFVSFDPSPQWSEEYYGELFRKIRDNNLQFKIIFSSWRLPTKGFFDAFAQTFDKKSAVLISPETGSDEIRKISRPNCFTNNELLERLEYADKIGVRTEIFFSIGALERNFDDFQHTLLLKQQIEERIENVSVEAFLVEVEPGAPWHLSPKKYGLNLLRQDFDDFIRDHSAEKYSSMTNLGYTTSFFGSSNMEPEDFYSQLLQLRCTHFCKKKIYCKVMQSMWYVARAFGIVPKPEKRTVEGLQYSESSCSRMQRL